VLVSAMHISASVFVNDHESGLWHDILEWLEKRWRAGIRRATGTTRPARTTRPHTFAASRSDEVNVPITASKLDLGPWQGVFYGEWDGQRRKRVVIKVPGEP
jgi:secondary thiamine-phosphate synthase enzyme